LRMTGWSSRNAARALSSNPMNATRSLIA
jgi:hypothetical protein